MTVVLWISQLKSTRVVGRAAASLAEGTFLLVIDLAGPRLLVGTSPKVASVALPINAVPVRPHPTRPISTAFAVSFSGNSHAPFDKVDK